MVKQVKPTGIDPYPKGHAKENKDEGFAKAKVAIRPWASGVEPARKSKRRNRREERTDSAAHREDGGVADYGFHVGLGTERKHDCGSGDNAEEDRQEGVRLHRLISLVSPALHRVDGVTIPEDFNS